MQPNNKTETTALSSAMYISSLPSTEPTRQLTDKHFDDLVKGSAISPEIAISAFESVELSGKLLNRRDEPGAGWRAIAVEPFTGEINPKIVSIKPDRLFKNEKGKTLKYLNKSNQAIDSFCLRMPDKYYWRKVGADVTQAIYIAEGAKKAASLLSKGYAAIAIAGAYNACQKMTEDEKSAKRPGKPQPTTIAFLQAKRTVYIIPDSDFRTKEQIANRYLANAEALRQYNPEVTVKILVWDETDIKGIDDLLVRPDGEEKLKNSINKALEIDAFNDLISSIVYEPSFQEFEESIEDAVIREVTKQHPDTYFRTEFEWYERTDGTQLKSIDKPKVRVMIARVLKDLVKVTSKGDRKKGLATQTNIENCYKRFEDECKIASNFKQQPNLLFCKNGIFDTNTDTFRSYSKGDVSLVNLPFTFDPKADCPIQILEMWLERFGDPKIKTAEEQKELLQALIRFYLDFPKDQGWNWFVHITGKSGTGKGLFCQMIQALYEPENVAAISDVSHLSDVKESYNYVKETKRLCIGEEVDSHIKNTAGLYSLVTGAKIATRKMRENQEDNASEPNVKVLLASTSALSASMTSNEGLTRRMIVLRTGGQKGESSLGYINFKSLVSQYASWALQMPRAKVKEVLLKLQKRTGDEAALSANAINRFVAECFLRVNDKDQKHLESSYVSLEDAVAHYKAWTKYEGVTTLSKNKLRERLEEVLDGFFKENGKVEKKNGKSYRPPHRFCGFRLASEIDDGQEPPQIKPKSLIEGQTVNDLIREIDDREPIQAELPITNEEPTINYSPQTTNPNQAIDKPLSEDLAF